MLLADEQGLILSYEPRHEMLLKLSSATKSLLDLGGRMLQKLHLGVRYFHCAGLTLHTTKYH